MLAVAPALCAGPTPPGPADPPPYDSVLADPSYATIRSYRFDDPGPTTLRDWSGSGIDGRYSGQPVFGLPGPFYHADNGGSSVLFVGSDQTAAAPSAGIGPLFASPDGVTIIVWFNTFTTEPAAVVGSFASADQTGGFQIGLGLSRSWGLAQHDTISFAIVQGPGTYLSSQILAPTFADQEWHMLACTFRAGAMRMDLDGLPQALTTISQGTLGPFTELTGDLGLGSLTLAGQPARRFQGQLGHISVHARALTPPQVLALWNSANAYTGQAVYHPENILPWVESARRERADAMVMGDSNAVITVNGQVVGHFWGMSQALRDRFPIYASALLPGLGSGGWGNPINGVSPVLAGGLSGAAPPAFIDERLPPFSAGFAASAAYVPAGESIPGSGAFRGPILWDAPDFLFDFTRDIDFHYTYATFAQGAGVMRPRVQQYSFPFAPLCEAVIPTGAGADAILEGVSRIPAGPRDPGGAYTMQLNDYSRGLPADGPLALLWTRLVLPDVRAGVSVTPLWAVGGQSARYAAEMFTRRASPAQLGWFMAEAVRPQTPGRERLLVQIIEGGNDTNDGGAAVFSDGSAFPIPSYTKEGQKLNTATIMSRLRDAWSARGLDPARLHFLLGPYHPADTTGPRVRSQFVRGWRELADEHPDWNITIMDGYGLSSVQEFLDSGWYDSSIGQAHLTTAGYRQFADRAWGAILGAVAPLETGACCVSSACTATTSASCPGVFQGPGAACGPAGNPTTCCPANFNGVFGVTVQDLFDFIGAYFAGDPRADFNRSGLIGVQDIFDFIAAFFVGCPG